MGHPDRLEARYKGALVRGFFVRFHMALILGGAFLAGVVANTLLFRAHLASLPLRYALAVVASYLAFFVLVRLWFAYVQWFRRKTLPDLDVPLDLPWWGRAGGRSFAGGRGGSFGGAGAQGSWAESASSELAAPPAPSSGGSAGWLPDFDLDIDLDEKAIVILIAFAALVLSVAGAAVYMIWNAPSILADAAFQLALSASLVRATRRIEATGWVGSVWRSTRTPFAIILVLAVTFGLVVRWYCPQAPALRSVVNECLARGGRP